LDLIFNKSNVFFEIGFDDKGKLFDKNGNLNKWWSDVSIKGFHEKSRCLIHQYNNFTMKDGVTVDGENTQGEIFNIPIDTMILITHCI
jgi:predicted metalloendopeptidase